MNRKVVLVLLVVSWLSVREANCASNNTNNRQLFDLTFCEHVTVHGTHVDEGELREEEPLTSIANKFGRVEINGKEKALLEHLCEAYQNKADWLTKLEVDLEYNEKADIAFTESFENDLLAGLEHLTQPDNSNFPRPSKAIRLINDGQFKVEFLQDQTVPYKLILYAEKYEEVQK